MKILLLILCFFIINTLHGQIRNPLTGGGSDLSGSTIFEDTTDYPDLIHEYVLASNMDRVIPFSDTAFNQRFQFVDPSRKKLEESIHMGYPGSSAMPLTYNSVLHRGWNLGYHQYDLYKTPLDSIRFYKSNRTTADLSFYQISGNQNNFNANADYHQNFKDDISLSINYKRYNFEGAYRNQDNQSTSFVMGFLHEPKGKTYSASFAFANNTHNESFSGGYVDSTQLTGPFSSFRGNVIVALDNNRNRHAEKAVLFSFKKILSGESLSLENMLIYEWNNYFYYDDGNLDGSDSTIYKSFITDNRGIRNQLTNRRLSNRITINSKLGKSIFLKAGLIYDRINILGEYADKRNDVTLLFDGSFEWRKIVVNVNGHLGFGENAGNTLLNALTNVNLGKSILLDLKWSSYVTEPSLIQRELILNTEKVYTNNFSKILGTSIKGGIILHKINTGFYLQQDVVNNVIYWDENSLPVQSDNLFTSTKLMAKTSNKVWKFGMDNSAVYQLFSEDIFHLPSWYTTHDLYFESHLFEKRLHLRIGSNTRLIASAKMNQFNPVVGQFYQEYTNTLLYPEWSAYIEGKIKRFRVLLQYDNITYWMTENVNENIARHPMLDANLKFGVRWLLLD